MRFFTRSSLIAAAILITATAASGETLRVGNPFPRAFSFLPINVALDQGIFKRHERNSCQAVEPQLARRSISSSVADVNSS
jgi:hypothetical protein